jgi:hypothetical protein
MPKPIWKGSAGIVEGGVTFAFAGGGSARRPERPRVTNHEDARLAANEQAEAPAKASEAVAGEAPAGTAGTGSAPAAEE